MYRSFVPVVLLLSCVTLRAELNLCNSAPITLWTAVAHPSGNDWVSEGWWKITPGDCVTVVGGDLTNRYYYAHAKSGSGNRVWGDDLNLCTSPEPFTIVLPHCPNENTRKFFKIDTGGARSVNHWLTCPACIDSRLVSAVQRYVPYLEQVANSSAPLSYTTPDPVDIGPVDIEYSVARGPFQISVQGNRISISTRLAYWVNISHIIPIIGARNDLASCGIDETTPLLDITLTTIFGVGDDGQLASKTRTTNLSFPTPCNLTKADIDGTGYIEEFARPQLDRLAATIDSKIHEIDVSRFINVNDLH